LFRQDRIADHGHRVALRRRPPPPHAADPLAPPPPPPPSGASAVGGFSDERRTWPEIGEPPVLPPFPGRRGAEFDGDPGSPPPQIQTVLLAPGAFSLIVAAVVFIAVTWRELGSKWDDLWLNDRVAACVASGVLARP